MRLCCRIRADSGAGTFPNYTVLADTWVFDANAVQWTQLRAAGPGPRFGATMAVVDGSVLLFGGFTELNAPAFSNITTNELWDLNLTSQTWSLLLPASDAASVPSPRGWGKLAAVNGTVFMVGGVTDCFFVTINGFVASTGILNDTWALTTAPLTWQLECVDAVLQLATLAVVALDAYPGMLFALVTQVLAVNIAAYNMSSKAWATLPVVPQADYPDIFPGATCDVYKSRLVVFGGNHGHSPSFACVVVLMCCR